MKRSDLLKNTLKNMAALDKKEIKKVSDAAQKLLEEKHESREEWLKRELSTMTHYFNELDLEDEIHFAHESMQE